MNVSLSAHRRCYDFSFEDAALSVITLFSGSSYALRHIELAENQPLAKCYGHRLLALIEFMPVLGGLCAITEKLVFTIFEHKKLYPISVLNPILNPNKSIQGREQSVKVISPESCQISTGSLAFRNLNQQFKITAKLNHYQSPIKTIGSSIFSYSTLGPRLAELRAAKEKINQFSLNIISKARQSQTYLPPIAKSDKASTAQSGTIAEAAIPVFSTQTPPAASSLQNQLPKFDSYSLGKKQTLPGFLFFEDSFIKKFMDEGKTKEKISINLSRNIAAFLGDNKQETRLYKLIDEGMDSLKKFVLSNPQNGKTSIKKYQKRQFPIDLPSLDVNQNSALSSLYENEGVLKWVKNSIAFLRIYQEHPFLSQESLKDISKINPKKLVQDTLNLNINEDTTIESYFVPLFKQAFYKEVGGVIKRASEGLDPCKKELKKLKSTSIDFLLMPLRLMKNEFLIKKSLKVAIEYGIKSYLEQYLEEDSTPEAKKLKTSLKKIHEEILSPIINKFIDSHSFGELAKTFILYFELKNACQNHLELMKKQYEGEKVNLNSTKARIEEKKEEFGLQLVISLQLFLKEVMNNPQEKAILMSIHEALLNFKPTSEEAFDSLDYSNQLWNKLAAPLLDGLVGVENVFGANGYEKSPQNEVQGAHAFLQVNMPISENYFENFSL